MAISVVNSSNAIENNGIGSSATTTPTFTSTAGNLLVGVGTSDTQASTGTMTNVGTDTWTQASGGHATSPVNWANLDYAKNIAGHANEAATFAVTPTGGDGASVCVIEVAGCDATSPVSAGPTFTNTGGGGGSTVNSALLTPAAGDHLVVVAGCGGNASGAQSVANNGTGTATWTTIKNDSGVGQTILLAYAIVTADGTHTYGVTYTNSGGTNGGAVGIASFKAAAAAAAQTPYQPWQQRAPILAQ